MKNCESLANAIRERLADKGSRVLFAGRLSGSELELGRAVGEYFRTAPAAARADSPELFSLVEKAERAGISGEVRDFYRGLGGVPEPFTDIWACGFARDILRLGPDELYVDGGAEDLFSSHRFARLTRGKYRGIIAFEPSPANYRVCLTNSALFDSRLSLRREALSSRCGGLRFTERGPDSRSDQGGELTVEAVTLDAALAGAEPSLIKLHLEGGELDAVEGAAETIRRCAPRLAVCLHRDEDALRIPARLLELRPDYRFWLRHYSSSATETVLYAVAGA